MSASHSNQRSGFVLRQVRVDQLVPSRGLAICQEITTGRSMEVPVLPMRVRLPKVGEQWVLDRTFGHWSFAALVSSPDLFDVGGLTWQGLGSGRVTVSETAPVSPQAGDTWVRAPVQVWDGTGWVTPTQ